MEENPKLVYNDEVVKIFLYTKGTKGGTQELKRLLTFLEESNSENATDEDLQEIQSIVETVKGKPEVRENYMAKMKVYNWGPIEYEIRDAAYADGKQEGRLEGEEIGELRGKIIGVIEFCKTSNMEMPQIKDALIKQFTITEEEADEYLKLYW